MTVQAPSRIQTPPGVAIRDPSIRPDVGDLLPNPALELIAALHRELEAERRMLLGTRRDRARRWDRGDAPVYRPDSVATRTGWRVAALPPDLQRRRVEITGPVNDAKMVINMLSRNDQGQRADAAMLDFEDSMMPSWENVLAGHVNLRDAADGSLSHEKRAPDGELIKRYQLDPEDMPLLMVRCRGLHLDERHLTVDGEPVAAGLFDLALAAFHTARRLLEQQKTPKYYVPKCEHYLEARWWNRLFQLLEDRLELDRGVLRTTFLIETLPAAFQVEEILYELRERAAGLNVGRWDKIFSDIKVLKEHPDRVLADRASISLNRPWMRAYAEKLIQVCHRHGAFAIGGMAAFTPGRTPELRRRQTEKVVADKKLEFELGHDGCWVSHPYFIGPALSAFPADHQLERIPQTPERPDLLPEGGGPRTLEGLRTNVRVGIGYMRGWQQGIGCVAWDDLMEDLATLEISRAQTWQWLRHGVELDDGETVTVDLVTRTFDQELARIQEEARAALADRPESERQAEAEAFARAAEAVRRIFTEKKFRPFFSIPPDNEEPESAEEAR